MVASSKDVLVIGGVVALGYIVYKGLGGFLNNFKVPSLPQLPSINISNPLNLSNPISTTFPNATTSDTAILESIKQLGGLASLQQSQIVDLLSKLSPLGSEANPANAPTAPTAIDVILNDKTLTDAQKKELIGIIDPYDPSQDSNTFDPNKFQPKDGQPPYDPYNPYGIIVEGEVFKKAPDEPTIINEVIPKELIDAPVQNYYPTTTITPTIQPTVNDDAVKITSFGGESAIGEQSFVINENPIDTLIEVLKYFPKLTASQASDFLHETGGKVLPSQVNYFDGDVKNIVANIGGENVQIDSVSSQDLKTQEMISAQFTCKEYGLNCDIAEGTMA